MKHYNYDTVTEAITELAKRGYVTDFELMTEKECLVCHQSSLCLTPEEFVIDEFHLFYYWGESFRPVLHDKFLCILNFYFPILAITATMDESVMNKMKKDLAYYQDFWIHLDYGNHALHRKPQKLVSFKGLRKRYFFILLRIPLTSG